MNGAFLIIAVREGVDHLAQVKCVIGGRNLSAGFALKASEAVWEDLCAALVTLHIEPGKRINTWCEAF
jgi:hypothetical protein